MTEQIAAEPVESAPQVEETTNAELANVEVEETTELEQGAAPESGKTGEPFVPPEEISDKVQKRINQLTWEKHEAERKWKAKYEQLEAQINQQAPAPTEAARPTLAQFDYDEDKYQEALIDFKVEQRMATTPAPEQPVQPDPAAVQWAAKQGEYASGNAEYVQLATAMPNAVNSKAVEQFIIASEGGPKLHHHLLSNYAELSRIQSLPEWQQGAELAKLETTLNQVKPKAKSLAPEPVKPIVTGTPTAGSSSSPFPKSW